MPLKVTILGAASAKPTVNTHPSAQIVNANEQYYLVDAGEGVQQQMFRNGINPLKLRAVFISHLHGDHVYGLFPLLSTLGLYGRQTPLAVYAPHPFGEILECHRRYFDQHVPYEVIWHEVDTTKHELLFENRSLEVWSIPLRHSLPASGYLFREKAPELNVDKFKIERYGLSIAQIVAAKRGEDITLDSGEVLPNSSLTYLPYQPASYAYCSDTNYSARIAEIVKGVTTLYHEATYADSEKAVAKQRGHATAAQAAKTALNAEAGELLIGHFSSRYKDPTILLDEARTIFPNTRIAEEGESYEIKR
ncbi:MAG: ribonuclease Z [Alistipes sp.]|jgi:ribonuclease Z|nr:ribonuclease Z [Alistipes sp.]